MVCNTRHIYTIFAHAFTTNVNLYCICIIFTAPLHLCIIWIGLKCGIPGTKVYLQLCTDCFHAMNTSTTLLISVHGTQIILV